MLIILYKTRGWEMRGAQGRKPDQFSTTQLYNNVPVTRGNRLYGAVIRLYSSFISDFKLQATDFWKILETLSVCIRITHKKLHKLDLLICILLCDRSDEVSFGFLSTPSSATVTCLRFTVVGSRFAAATVSTIKAELRFSYGKRGCCDLPTPT